MADTLCAFPDRDDALVTYLYDDMDAAERATFDAHLAICARCRNEVHDLRGVREHLTQWAPPFPAAGIRSNSPLQAGDRSVRLQPDSPAARRSWSKEMPAWAQVAAALLFVGISAGIANLDVRYDSRGLSVRTGWSQRSAGAGPALSTARTGVAQDTAAPWRADLTSLEQQLRAEMHAASESNRPVGVATAADARGGLSEAEVTARIRTMIAASEKRQQTELALRVAETYNTMRAQRNADMIKVDAVLGALKSDTSTELLRQRASINYLVSAKQRQ